MIKCERCRTNIGEYIIDKKRSTIEKKFVENAVVMPCCRAEVCLVCIEKIKEKSKCPFCGRSLKDF